MLGCPPHGYKSKKRNTHYLIQVLRAGSWYGAGVGVVMGLWYGAR